MTLPMRLLHPHLLAALLGLSSISPARAVLEFEPATCHWFMLQSPDYLYRENLGGPSLPRRAADLIQRVELFDTDLLATDDPQGPTLGTGFSQCVLPFRTYGSLVTHQFSALGRIFAAVVDEPGAYLSMFFDVSSRIIDSEGRVRSSFEQRYDILPGPGDAGAVDLDVDYSPPARLLALWPESPPGPGDYPFGPRYFLDSTITWGLAYRSAGMFFDFAGALRDSPGNAMVRASISEFPYYLPEPGVLGLLAAGAGGLVMLGAPVRASRQRRMAGGTTAPVR